MSVEMATRCTSLFFLLIFLGFCGAAQSRKPPIKPKVNLFPGRLIARYDFLEDCKNITSLSAFTTRSTMKAYSKNNFAIDADILVTRVIAPMTLVITIIHNCEDRASGNCPHFHTWRFGPEFCTMMLMKNQLWSPIVENISPRLNCTLAPGQYILRNGSLDRRILEGLPFPLERYFWRLRMEVYDPALYLCNIVGVQFFRIHT